MVEITKKKPVPEPVFGQNPEIMSLYAPGGGMSGIVPLSAFARIEELTNLSVAELFQHKEAASVSGFLIAAHCVPKSLDPKSGDFGKPRHTSKEGLKLFVERTPEVFPYIENRFSNMLKGQVVEADLIPELMKNSNQGFAQELGNQSEFDILRDSFNESSLFSNDWAFVASYYVYDKIGFVNDWKNDFQYDPENLEKLYKDVLGEDTKLSHVIGALSIPAYNVTEGKVEFFTVTKDDAFDINSKNSNVSNDDPYLWEVAMASTANTLALPMFELDDTLYADAAACHRPTTHRDLIDVDKPDAPKVNLIEFMAKPKPLEAGLLGKVIGSAFKKLAKALDEEKPDTKNGLLFKFTNVVRGICNGGLSSFTTYSDDMDSMNVGRPDANTHTIIAPDSAKNKADALMEPSVMEGFTAMPETISKILDYSKKMLQDRDSDLKDLSIKLVANQVRMGNMSLDEYHDVVKDIQASAYENSDIPIYIDSLKSNLDTNQHLGSILSQD